MSDAIETVAALETCIGKTPGAVNLKVIDHLDAGALRWIAASPLLFACFGDADGIDITLGGGEPGFVRALDSKRLRLPAAAMDEPLLARVGRGFGALLLTPSIGETLRVNGRVVAITNDEIEIDVEECYVHCAKALLRSDFWNAMPLIEAPSDAADLLAASRFMALATIDAQGRADVSPKGDPAGALIRLHHGDAWYPDRPGNRRTDSFRNILVQPRVAAAVLIPGSTRIAVLSGTAQITTDTTMRSSFSVAGKTPLLVTRIEQQALAIRDSTALARAQLWPATPRAADIDPAAMFVAHVKLSKTRGLQATLVRTAVSTPGLMEKSLQHDYKNNLY